MRLLHASGFDPASPQRVTRHDHRLDGGESGRVAALLERYADDPLAAGPGSFREWLAGPADGAQPPITRLWAGVHALRAELRESYPDPLGADRTAYAAWIEADGAREYGVDVRLPRRRRRRANVNGGC